MRLAVAVVCFVFFAIACENSTAGPNSSPPLEQSPIGTATLSATDCNFAMPDRIPSSGLRFKLVNQTAYSGHFIFAHIHDGHTFNELVDYWNGPMGQVEAPSFITEIQSKDVPTNSSGEMVVGIVSAGTYAFHCGYADPATNRVKGFWHQLSA